MPLIKNVIGCFFLKWIVAVGFLLSLGQAQAESGRSDYDLDNDGLIEINDLADLNEIRNDLTGASLYGSSSGCPGSGCNGYELTTDLDFDTDSDGKLNDESYYNSGSGWRPIGANDDGSYSWFSAILEGNGYSIRNLYINRGSTNNVGLIAIVKGATLRNLHISGSLTSITGGVFTGGLFGFSQGTPDSTISNCSISGTISGNSFVGGFGGQAYISSVSDSYVDASVTASGSYSGGLFGSLPSTSGSTIERTFARGSVSGGSYTGGLIGFVPSTLTLRDSYAGNSVSGGQYVGGLAGALNDDATLQRLYARGSVTGSGDTGGLLGSASGTVSVTRIYWDTETTGQSGSAGDYGSGLTSTQLQCPTSPGDSSCQTSVYAGWPATHWDFGTSNQYPVSILNGLTFRDTDGDGEYDPYDSDIDNDDVENDSDAFPYDDSESSDNDGDGIGDNADTDDDNDDVEDAQDAFPFDDTETSDADGDGIGDNADPDDDNDNVEDALDAFPYDETESADNDGDGIGDNADTDDDNDNVNDDEDAFPFDPTGSSASDDVDVDDNGLIEIDSLVDLNAMRDDLSGSSLSGITAGCPEEGCIGYELTRDLDFDSDTDGDLSDEVYWNSGNGWSSVGTYSAPFAAVFNGNGYRISNLYLDRNSDYQGLFGYTQSATLLNVGLNGALMSISGQNSTGGLVGFAGNTVIASAYSTGPVTGHDRVGGLVGTSSLSQIQDCYATGDVRGTSDDVGGLVGVVGNSQVSGCYATGQVSGTGEDSFNAGGLIGSLIASDISSSFATGKVSASENAGGLVGYAATNASIAATFAVGSVYASADAGGLIGLNQSNSVTYSYWATDTSSQSSSGNQIVENGYFGKNLVELQCATTADDFSCTSDTLYSGWSSYLSTGDALYWDFGTETQLPGLRINGVVHRDSDGDGVLDGDDSRPSDHDNDGIPDAVEVDAGLNVADPTDAEGDRDGDGLSNLYEYENGSDITTDSVAPVITLSGDASVMLTFGDSYTDAGATAEDGVDGDITGSIVVVSTVDTSAAGIYSVTYDVSDAAGNAADTVIRSVAIEKAVQTITFSALENKTLGDVDFSISATASSGLDVSFASTTASVCSVSNTTVTLTGYGECSIAASQSGNDNYLSSEAVTQSFTVSDMDSDGDGIEDYLDAYPFDYDNDGVNDSDDAFPYDASESADSDGDGTGDNSDPTPNGDDADSDNDGMPDAYEVENGLDIDDPSDADSDLDGDGLSNLAEYLAGSDINVDDVPPVLMVPADIEVVSTGATTAVELGSAFAEDAKDGTIIPVADDIGPFVPGRHRIIWTAEDAAGNSISAEQIVDVIPLVSMAAAQTVEEGTSGSIEVLLNGAPVTYPVRVTYLVGGTADGSDHGLLSGSVDITSGLSGSIPFETLSDEIFEGDETLVVTLENASNAALGSAAEQVITLIEGNAAPTVSISLLQGNYAVSTVYSDAGMATVIAEVSDPNPSDSHTFSWSSESLAPVNGYTSESFTFDPNGLSGAFRVQLSVVDVAGESVNASLLLSIEENAPDLSASEDSDNDGVNDVIEGYGDSDGDRIPDYLDANDATNQLPMDGLGALIQSDSGTSLRLGDVAYVAGFSIAQIGLDDIDVLYGESLAGSSGYQFLHGIFDFEVHGVVAGASTRVVLPQTSALFAGAQYLKYKQGIGWVAFSENAGNSVSSAPGELGVCPAPGSADYQPGLAEGHFCVQLTIEDGGANDADGVANGIVVDPGAVGTLAVSQPVVFVAVIPLEEAQFSAGDGEKVVLAFTLESDSSDAELKSLALQATGEMEEGSEVSEVRLYLDKNENGQADASELIGSGSFTRDDETLIVDLPSAIQLPAGQIKILVTYQF